MERLLADAEKLTGRKYNVENFADIAEAIHAIQDEMGITGTTAKEASETISGSIATMQSAWQNLLTGLGDKDADLGGLVDNLVESAETVIENIMPVIEHALEGIGTLIEKIAPIVAEKLPPLVETILPPLLQAATSLVIGLVEALPTIIQVLIDQAPVIISALVNAIIATLPAILDVGRQLVGSLTGGMDAGQLAQKGLELLARLLATIAAKAPELLQKGIELVGQLAAGLIRAIPKVVAAIPQIISRIRTTFGQFDWGALGLNIIMGIARGIAGAASAIGEALMGAVKGAWSTVTGWLGIHSPSKRAEKEVGVNWAEGYAVGFVRQMPKVGQEMLSAVSDTFDALNGVAGVGFGSGSAGGGGTFAPVINIYGAEGQDVNALADIVMSRMAVEYRRKRESYATA